PRKPKPKVPPQPLTTAAFSLRFGQPPPSPDAPKAKPQRAEKPKTPRVKVKIDPQNVAKARELRDRCMERVNGHLLLAVAKGKYDVSRAIGVGHPVLHRLAG
ncbi:MAG: hypothetical protein M3478_07970, partial [Planctomycetota bacterium]|nr:hypothetical protein [Planctomycetota bacterium]